MATCLKTSIPPTSARRLRAHKDAHIGAISAANVGFLGNTFAAGVADRAKASTDGNASAGARYCRKWPHAALRAAGSRLILAASTAGEGSLLVAAAAAYLDRRLILLYSFALCAPFTNAAA